MTNKCKYHTSQDAVTELDDEPLCQNCANEWVRGEGAAAAEHGDLSYDDV